MHSAVADSRATPLLPPPEYCEESDGRTSPTARRSGWHRRLGMVSVTMIIFFNVSGGPLGSEEIISSIGPLPGLCLIVAFALLFSVPQAMITAELSTAFPDNGGYSLWVQAAFGDFWGLQESYWSWFSGVVDSALYPVLLYSSASQLLASDGFSSPEAGGDDVGVVLLGVNHSSHNHTDHHVCPAGYGDGSDDDDDGVNLWWCLGASPSCAPEYLTKLGILLLFSTPNLVSSELVGRVLAALGALVMLPFALLCLVALPQVRSANLLALPKHADPALAFSVVYWSLSGFDSASTIAGEVEVTATLTMWLL